MLLLRRRIGQKIMINDNIVITITKMDQDSVMVGIEATGDVEIWREEIYKKIQEDKLLEKE